MVTIHNISTYSIQPEDKFFFDTQIWMYMHCSIGNYNSQLVQEFSDFYQNVREVGATIYITSMLISEFINTYSRLEFNIIKNSAGLSDFKRDFRKNPSYKPILDSINLLTERKVIKNSVKINDEFANFSESPFFQNPNTYDFHDEYFCYLAEKLNFKIVTNDSDFQHSNYNLEIITR